MSAAGSPQDNGGFYQQLGGEEKLRIVTKTGTGTGILQDDTTKISEKNNIRYFTGENEYDLEDKRQFYQAYTKHT